VIEASRVQYEADDLVNYLLMARTTLKEPKVDNELIFAYAKGGEKYLSDLETFVKEPNQANSQMCGDRCFDDKLFEAAEILFKKIGNFQKLAQVYVMLKKYQMAFDAAKRADVPKVWKAVCFACVRAKEFNMAALCGQHIIIHPDHLKISSLSMRSLVTTMSSSLFLSRE
jgi:clathrin heavy chain